MFIYEVKNSLSVGAGVVLKNLERVVFEHYLRLNLPITNKAEYEASITGLKSFRKLQIPELHIFSASKNYFFW